MGDIASPRRAITAAAGIQGALTALIALPLGLHRGLWAVYVLAALSQLVGGSWQPLTAAVMAQLATPDDRHRLNLAYIMLSGSAIVVSPALGVLLLPAMGAFPLVLADAATFLVAAQLFLSLPPMPAAAHRRFTLHGAAFAGFAAVLKQRTLRVIAAGTLCATVTITALQTTLPQLAAQRFGHAADAGVLYASVGLGSMGGSLLALWTALRHRRVILLGNALNIAAIGLAGITPSPALDLLLLAAGTAAAALAQVEGGVVVQSQPLGTVGRIQGAISTSRFLGMAGGSAIALVVALTVKGNPGTLVLLLAGGGLLVLIVSAFGPSDTVATRERPPTITSLGEVPE